MSHLHPLFRPPVFLWIYDDITLGEASISDNSDNSDSVFSVLSPKSPANRSGGPGGGGDDS